MPFWSATGLDTPEPKRNYRWLVYVGGIDPWVAKKVTKPGFTVTETTHTWLNYNFYYPGKVEWNTISLTFVDPASPDLTQTIYNALKGGGYVFPESQNEFSTLAKSLSRAALGTVRIQQIGDNTAGVGGGPTNDQGQANTGGAAGSTAEVVEEWFLYNAWIKDAKFGELDYTSDDLTEVTLELRYDYAKLNQDNKAGTTMKNPITFGK